MTELHNADSVAGSRPQIEAALYEHLNNGCTDWRCELNLNPAEGLVHADEPMIAHLADEVFAAIDKAEADALALHQRGECHLSEWSCSHCEADLTCPTPPEKG